MEMSTCWPSPVLWRWITAASTPITAWQEPPAMSATWNAIGAGPEALRPL